MKPKLIKDFSLIGKKLVFYFHRYNCYEEYSGHCLLHNPNQLLEIQEKPNTFEKGAFDYCPNLSKVIISCSKPSLFPVYLYKYKCGHYQTGQGQHRLCIAGNLVLKIPVLLGDNKNQVCGYCNEPEVYTIKSF